MCISEPDSLKVSDIDIINNTELHHKLSDQSVRVMINRYAELAGISQHITPHMFRHSFAALLMKQDVDIRYIQKMLGHSSISTAEIYACFKYKAERYPK